MHILIITPKGKKMHMKAEIRNNKTERDPGNVGEASYPTSADRVCKKDCNEWYVQIVGKKAHTPALQYDILWCSGSSMFHTQTWTIGEVNTHNTKKNI